MKKLRYFKLFLRHKYYVFKAGRRLGLGIWQLLIHDLSKLSLLEYPHYQRWFFENKNDPDGFAYAWLYHQNRNKHHWDYWIARTGHRIGVQGGYNPHPLPMPEKYVKEMIADWQAAGLCYAGTDNIQGWIDDNWHKMKFHEETEWLLDILLNELGYYWPKFKDV